MIKTGFQLNRRLAALAASVLLMAGTQLTLGNSAHAADGDVTEYKLNNGLRVVVKEDHRSPTVAHMVWYKAGSMDEYNGYFRIATTEGLAWDDWTNDIGGMQTVAPSPLALSVMVALADMELRPFQVRRR